MPKPLSRAPIAKIRSTELFIQGRNPRAGCSLNTKESVNEKQVGWHFMRSDSRQVTYLKFAALWSFRLVVAALLLTALLVVGVRVFIGTLPFFHHQLVEYLNDKLDTSFVVEQLEANWSGGRPTVNIKGLKLQGNHSEASGFAIHRLDFELDLTSSLMSWAPVFSYLKADGIAFAVESDSDGVWSLRGIQFIRDDGKGFNLKKFLRLLQLQKDIDVTHLSFTMQPFGREPLILDVRYFSIVEESSFKQLQTQVVTQQGSLKFKAQGEDIERSDMAWSGLIAAEALDLASWCGLILACPAQLQTAPLNLDTQWEYLDGQWLLQGHLELPSIVYQKDQQVRSDLAIATELSLSRDYLSDSTDWKLELQNFRITAGQQTFDLNFRVAGTRDKESMYTAAVDAIDLAALRSFLISTRLLPEPTDKLLTTLNPTGELNEILARYYPEKPLPEQLHLTANLKDVSVDAWGGTPSASNVNGRLKMGTFSGYFDLDSEGFNLGLTRLFRDVWHFDRAKARLSWDVLAKESLYQLRSDNITLKGPEGDLAGQLRLDVPLDEEPPVVMDLGVTMKNGDASYTSKYLPSKLPALSKELVEWLDTSIKGAEVNEGRFSYHGSLENKASENVQWGLYFDVDKARLDYHPAWPEVYDARGQVWVDHDTVKVDLESAKFLNAKLNNLQANLVLDNDLELNIFGQLAAKGQDIKKLLTKTPIDQKLKGEGKKWTIRGDLEGSIRLAIPVKQALDTSVDVRIKTANGYFGVDAADIQIEGIRGDLNYSTKAGLSSKKVKGRFLGGAVEASIFTDVTDKTKPKLYFNWEGSVSSQALQQWLQLDALSVLEGASDYQGKLILGEKPADVQLQVTSHLKGMAVKLPAPLQISADQAVPFELRFNQFAHRDVLDMILGRTGRARIRFGKGFKYESSVVLLGSKGPLPERRPGRIVLSGQIPELDLMPWKQLFQEQFQGQLQGQPDNKTLMSQVEMQKLKIGQLLFDKEILNNLVLDLSHETQGARLTFSSDKMDGSLMIPENQNRPYQLNLKTLRFSKSQPERKPFEERGDVLEQVEPAELPNADISIESLKLGDGELDSVSLTLRPLPNGKRIENLKANFQNMALSGELNWTGINGKHKTTFGGQLSGSGIQAVQEALGISPVVSAQKTTLDGKLAWNGSPQGINMSSLTGKVRFKLERGTLQKIEGGAGALKLLGILNLEALTRRLRFDFSDLYKKGISFDHLDGLARFDKGIVTFDRPLEITGPSSDFKLDGRIDTVTEQLDLSLVVMLPVASNLPILSVLLGTAPQVAGLIYLADILVGKQMDQLASIRYRITGSFDNPEVTLDQLFSSKAKKPDHTEIPKRKKR